MTRHELNTPEIAYIKYSLVCSPCRSSLDKDLDKGRLINYTIFDWKQVEAEKGAFPTFKTPTLIKYEERKEQLKKDEKPNYLNSYYSHNSY
ncbi:MAG: hypothetical protein MRERV_19c027 [Mycoplasmataceae bacterium RV_VA103A]|nr:MAG: hypothetical protein MRERV_19c027 [Mycoplasmataceae bacterium RV_VA103A]